MKLPRGRFSVRWLMVSVALSGLNLAALASTSRFYPRPRPPLRIMIGNGLGYISYLVEGQVEYGQGNAETGYRRTRVEPLTPRPTLLRIWSPVIASAGASILTLGVATRRRARTIERSATREVSTKAYSGGCPVTKM